MSKNKSFVDSTITNLILNPDKLNHCFGKLSFVKSNLPKEEWQRYIRFVINDEYFSTVEKV